MGGKQGVMNKNKSFEDIRNVDYPVKKTRLRMSIYDRAAQFSPFAALTGYDSLIEEIARLTDGRTSTALEKISKKGNDFTAVPFTNTQR